MVITPVLSRLLVPAKSSSIPQNKSPKNRETTHSFTESLQPDQLSRGLFSARLVTEFVSVQAGISAHTEHWSVNNYTGSTSPCIYQKHLSKCPLAGDTYIKQGICPFYDRNNTLDLPAKGGLSSKCVVTVHPDLQNAL